MNESSKGSPIYRNDAGGENRLMIRGVPPESPGVESPRQERASVFKMRDQRRFCTVSGAHSSRNAAETGNLFLGNGSGKKSAENAKGTKLFGIYASFALLCVYLRNQTAGSYLRRKKAGISRSSLLGFFG